MQSKSPQQFFQAFSSFTKFVQKSSTDLNALVSENATNASQFSPRQQPDLLSKLSQRTETLENQIPHLQASSALASQFSFDRVLGTWNHLYQFNQDAIDLLINPSNSPIPSTSRNWSNQKEQTSSSKSFENNVSPFEKNISPFEKDISLPFENSGNISLTLAQSASPLAEPICAISPESQTSTGALPFSPSPICPEKSRFLKKTKAPNQKKKKKNASSKKNPLEKEENSLKKEENPLEKENISETPPKRNKHGLMQPQANPSAAQHSFDHSAELEEHSEFQIELNRFSDSLDELENDVNDLSQVGISKLAMRLLNGTEFGSPSRFPLSPSPTKNLQPTGEENYKNDKESQMARWEALTTPKRRLRDRNLFPYMDEITQQEYDTRVPSYVKEQVSFAQINRYINDINNHFSDLRFEVQNMTTADDFITEADLRETIGIGAKAKTILLLLIQLKRMYSQRKIDNEGHEIMIFSICSY